MNCKPGDLAIVVGEDPDCLCNIGALLIVIEPEDPDEPGTWGFCEASRPLKTVGDDGHSGWVTDSRYDDYCHWMYDKHLRPIRDNPGADETLSWKQVPSKEHA